MSDRSGQPKITPEMVLRAYAIGIFPMAETRDDPNLYWIDPERRGIIPLDRFHVPRSLRKAIRHHDFDVTFDQDFEGVLLGCAAPGPGRRQTWISDRILDLCMSLHAMGYAHSVEVREEGRIVGGLYGVALGGAFFGESMFSRKSNASKIALVALVERLRAKEFLLLDTQFVTEHLMQFGAIEISREEYRQHLRNAISAPAQF